MTDTKLHFVTTGSSKNPAILFLHGFLGAGSDWDNIADFFSNDFFCILPDLPGHGKSDIGYQLQNYSFQSTAEQLISMLDEYQIRTAIFIGYSMGARLALYTYFHHSIRLKAMVLEGVNPGFRTSLEITERLKWENQICERLQDGMEPFLDYWTHLPLFHSLHEYPEKLNALKLKRLQNRSDRLILSMKAAGLSQQTNFWPRLKQINVPLMLVAGEKDEKFLTITKEFVKEYPRAELTIIPKSGHNTHWENPEGYSNKLNKFLNGIG